MRPAIRSLSLALLLLLPTSATALEPGKALTQYARDDWSVEQGLPQSSVFALVQARDGYVWMATEEGLARFDGARFTVFDNRSVPALARSSVSVALEDAEGAIWGGTVGGELLRIRDGRADVPVKGKDVENGQVTALARDAGGGLWIGTDRGDVYRYRAGRLEPRSLATGTQISGLAEKDGTLWIGTVKGLLRRRGEVVEPLGPAQGIPAGPVGGVSETRSGTLFVGYQGAVCSVRGDAVSCLGAAQGIPAATVSAVVEDRQGNLWLATREAGVARFSDGKTTSLGEKEGLPSSAVRALLEDREGGLWIGLEGGGVVRLRDGAVTPLGVPEGLCGDLVWSTAEDAQGAIWAGTHASGLCRIEGQAVKTFRVKDGLPSDIIFAVAPARDGGVWAGTPKGVVHVKGDAIVPLPGALSRSVVALLEDGQDRLFAATLGGGLGVRENGVLRVLHEKDGLPSEFVNGLVDDRQGGVWIATRNGLVHYRDGHLETPLGVAQGLPDPVNPTALLLDEQRTLWVSTDGGLARQKGSRFVVYNTKQGLFQDKLFHLLEDGQGFLWATTSQGIFRISKRELDEVDAGRRAAIVPLVLARAEGMRHPECNGGAQNAGARLRDGRLVFPTLRGLAFIDPARLPRNDLAPAVAVESVLAGSTLEVPGDLLVLPPDRRKLEIHYAGLSFNAPSRVLFRYRLEGFETAWVEAGNRRTAYYTGLQPGEYTFHVAAANESGVWNETGASLRLRLEPRFHETRPFFVLCAATLGLLGFGAYRLRERRLRARSQELERLVTLRTEELRQSHAELSQANQELQRILQELQGAQAQLVQSEKMASLGQMVAGVAHEINNPTNFISGAAENLRVKTQEFRTFLDELMGEEARSEVGQEVSSQLDELGRMIQTIKNGTERVKKIVLSLRSFSRLDEAEFKEVDLHEGIESTLEIVQFKFKDRIKLVRSYGELPRVSCNASQINQVIMNLLVNASQAIEGEGTITIATGLDGPGFVHVDVTDTGSGIPADKLEKIFDPFYTTKKVGEGTGLGLSISYGIAKDHGGEIKVSSTLGKGTSFRLRLPIAQPETRPAAPPGRT